MNEKLGLLAGKILFQLVERAAPAAAVMIPRLEAW